MEKIIYKIIATGTLHIRAIAPKINISLIAESIYQIIPLTSQYTTNINIANIGK